MMQVFLNILLGWLPDDLRTVVVFGIIVCACWGVIKIIGRVLDAIPFV